MVAGLGDEDEPNTAVAAAPAEPSPVPARGAGWAVPTRITDIPQLAAAARARGQTDRIIYVDPRPPPVIRTPGRRANQWLAGGEMLLLPIACPICGWWRDGACQCPENAC